jgi:4,5-dihydroxyphthalate decarboxylase
MYNTDALGISLPWLIDEIEKTRQLMGDDYWDYSLRGSLPTLHALTRHLYEQGLTARQMPLEQLFVKNIQDGLHQYMHGTGEDR